MTTDRPAETGESAEPDDPEQIRQQIERTREQLSETVEALVAKVDVKARARERVDELSQRWKDTTAQMKERCAQARQQAAERAAQARQQAAERAVQARQQAADRAAQARGQLASKTADARTAALDTGRSAGSQLQARAGAVGAAVRDKTPEPVQRAVRQAARRVSDVGSRRSEQVGVAAVAVAVAVLAGIIVIGWRRRR